VELERQAQVEVTVAGVVGADEAEVYSLYIPVINAIFF
jgi:hypothetical protein